VNDSLLKLYQSLPYTLRCLVATVRGWQLRSWRYGCETDRLVQDALEREHWSSEKWKAWQEERLQFILHRAVAKVPYYREIWEEQNAESRKQKVSDLRNWPVLKKAALRGRPEAFVAEDCVRRHMFCEHTSGSTGTPLTIWQSRKTIQAWYALFEARWREWYGLSRHDRWAIMGGQLVTPTGQLRLPFWVWNSGLHQLYLSSYHLRPENATAYVQALGDHEVIYLWGYASSLATLARDILDQGLKPPPLRAAISNAEPLYAHQRELIRRAFGCRVYNTYGMSEMVSAASECEAGKLHLWPEVGIYEVLHDDEDKPVDYGETGRLVCTGLLNRDMPLIRYAVGDRVAIAPPGETCECGRTLPILLSVEGRSDDVILTPDGRRIGRLDPVFKGDIPMREGQIIQESLELIRVLVVPAREFTEGHERDLIAAVRERVGDLEVQVERVSEIPRSANGKFRAVISKVNGNRTADRQINHVQITGT